MMFGLVASTAFACGETNEATRCEQAVDHLQACFPDQEARMPDSCTDSSAEAILAQDCGELESTATAQAGAADGFCNPFFWWMCPSSGSGSSVDRDEPTGYSFNLGINRCSSDLCVEDLFGELESGAECGVIRLEDARGNLVATDYVNDHMTWGGIQDTGEGFSNLDLPAGNYVAKLMRRDGDQALNVEGGPAEIEVALLDGGGVDLSARNFRILNEEADAVKACTNVVGALNSTCGGEQMEKDDIEKTWVVKIEGVNSEGTYENIKRNMFTYNSQSHLFSFPKVRAGSYNLTYIELDIWSSYDRRNFRNLKYDDYLEYIEDYATGVEFTQEIEVSLDDAGQERTSIGGVVLESEVCL
jgi:hypothetical protein